MPGEGKNVEPMTALGRGSAKHQSLLPLMGQATWSDEAVLAEARRDLLPAIEAQGRIEAWIVDDTGSEEGRIALCASHVLQSQLREERAWPDRPSIENKNRNVFSES
jgi:SRSO17 transposase